MGEQGRLAQEGIPHDFNRCRCDQWGRCLVHCPTCDCVSSALAALLGASRAEDYSRPA